METAAKNPPPAEKKPLPGTPPTPLIFLVLVSLFHYYLLFLEEERPAKKARIEAPVEKKPKYPYVFFASHFVILHLMRRLDVDLLVRGVVPDGFFDNQEEHALAQIEAESKK